MPCLARLGCWLGVFGVPVKTSGRVFSNPEKIVDPSRLLDIVEKKMRETVDFGEDRMKTMIETRGTGETWSRPSKSGRTGSYPGRVDTGKMIGGVKAEVERNRNSIVGQYGWIDENPEWHAHQEWGFKHAITGKFIRGMRSLRDSANEADEVFDTKMREAVQEYLRGR